MVEIVDIGDELSPDSVIFREACFGVDDAHACLFGGPDEGGAAGFEEMEDRGIESSQDVSHPFLQDRIFFVIDAR